MSRFETFLQLHQNAAPLLLGNIWDINSAKIFEASGYKAIGSSSHAVAKSLGYDDGEKLPFEILLKLAKKVVETVSIPFSVDMEGGYSRVTREIIWNIEKLHDAGVVGINLEDTIAGTTRQWQPVAEFQRTLSAIAEHIGQHRLNMFLNIRTDGFLLGRPTALADTLTRVKAYENAGAHGIFVPCITGATDIETVVQATPLPINVMCMPELPDFETLQSLGVKRISMGGFFLDKVYNTIGSLSKTIRHEKSFSAIL